MAWSVGRAGWVGELSDPEISQQVGRRTFERGVAYRTHHRVRSLAAGQDGLILLGTVEGSRAETYQSIVTARPHPRGRSHVWSGRCSCPVGADCKHVVALLLVARDVAHGIVSGPSLDEPVLGSGDGAAGLTEPMAPMAPTPTEMRWSEVFRLADPVPDAAGASGRPQVSDEWSPAGIYFDTIYVQGAGSRGAPQRGVGLRASRQIRTGTWHRSLSWREALAGPLPGHRQWPGRQAYPPEQERVMSAIHEAGRVGGTGSTQFFTTVVPIRLDASGELWSLLAQARDRGVELLPGEGLSGPIGIEDEPVTLVVEIDRAPGDSGDLLLHVRPSGLEEIEGERTYVGTPVHGVTVEPAGGGLILAPLQQSLGLDAAALTQAIRGLRVPAGERAEFLQAVYPRLRRLARVRSRVPLPLVPPDEAADVVTVHVRVSSDI
ncbi:MAG: SWIM zinc finger family protein, partial [Micrococcales bacterium]|nr:SWIM zinc finger family protein [Micrococcales bacterium]